VCGGADGERRTLSRCAAGRFLRTSCAQAIAVLVALQLLPSTTRAQLSDPCATACGATLVAVGAVAATGAVATLSRLEGGLSTTSEGLWVWGSNFATVVGAGAALSGNGARQERAVYAAAIGSLAGAALGLALGAATVSDDGARSVAAALIGAASGVVAGGVYGALSHDDGGAALTPSLSLSVPF
jgi:hypothetical protein